jgi:regulator of protease activity HflC (stomatin/prohibitin superfamily)
VVGGSSRFGWLVACVGHLRLLRLFHAAAERGPGVDLVRRVPGTVRISGWHWTNPLNTKLRLSLRSRNFNSEKLKVNDKRGNPIEIAVVVVWRVQDTAQASFDVDQFREYVEVQSESAVRHLANCYPYDHGEEDEITLRSGVEDISQALQHELQDRVQQGRRDDRRSAV